MHILIILLLKITAQATTPTTTTTVTTQTPFHKNFVEICKVDASILEEPHKSRILDAKQKAGCK